MELERRIEILERENAEFKRQLEIRQKQSHRMNETNRISIKSKDLEKAKTLMNVIISAISFNKEFRVVVEYNPEKENTLFHFFKDE